MHITCHECNTIFDLDERLLKPGGSKVRCSQCGNIFRAYPPAPEHLLEPESALESGPAPEPVAQQALTEDQESAADSAYSEDATDQKLEGIDLAELDAIFENEPLSDEAATHTQEDEASPFGEDDLVVEDEEGDTELDLDFDMELESGETDVRAVEDEMSDDVLDDLDLDMDFDLDAGAEFSDREAADQAEKDIEAVDKQIQEAAEEKDVELALDDIDLDTLEGDAPPESREAAEVPLAEETDTAEALQGGAEDVQDPSLDDLDLALEGLDEEDASGLPAASETLEFEELSLDDLDTAAQESPSEAADDFHIEAPAAAETDSLDLGDLKLDEILDEAGAESDEDEPALEEELTLEEGQSTEENFAAEQSPSSEEELELNIDEHPPALETEALPGVRADAAQGNESDELDLSDLDEMFKDSVDEETEAPESASDLELDLGEEKPAQEEGLAEDATLEELDFELDAEFEKKPVAKTVEPEPAMEVEAEDEELDLSDIEQMLEGEALLEPVDQPAEAEISGEPESLTAGLEDEIDINEIEEAVTSSDNEATTVEPDAADEDLDFDFSLDEKPPEAEVELEDLDLDLDLGEGLEAPDAETPVSDQSVTAEADDSLDLDLDLEVEDNTATQDAAEELNISDLDGLVEDDKVDFRSETIDTGDIELEFEVEERVEEDYEPSTSQTFRDGSDLTVEETVTAQADAVAAAPKTRPIKKKKGTNKLLVFVLILVLLGAGGYYGYDFVIKNDIQIPYLSDYLNPKPKDPAGTNNLSVLDINSKFMDSQQTGRLFIISGKVRNGYSDNRSMIQLSGKLFSKGKVLVKNQTVYAGVLIPDQELKTLPLAEIKQRLDKIPGARDAGASVRPGQTLPFMLVFSELPDDLDEFVIEKVRSQPVP